ncbi:MAG: sulfurtransferase [Pseudomonadales bacterium]
MTPTLPPLIAPEDLGDPSRPGTRLVHVAEAAAYRQAHLPGAVLVEPRQLVIGTPPAPGRLPDRERLDALFGALGLHDDLHLVVYDDEGGGWAGRLIWTLDVIGHRRWSYLDGGLHAWHAAGLPLESGAGVAPEATRVRVQIDRGPIAEVDDVLAATADRHQLIWDVRSAEEYRGERSGSRRAGHVPGAVNLDWLLLMDPNRALRLVADLESLLAEHGISADKRVITHCQSHHRSGLSYLVGRLLGFDIRAFHGSWAEWGNRDDLPVVTGAAPGQMP